MRGYSRAGIGDHLTIFKFHFMLPPINDLILQIDMLCCPIVQSLKFDSYFYQAIGFFYARQLIAYRKAGMGKIYNVRSKFKTKANIAGTCTQYGPQSQKLMASIGVIRLG